MKTQVLLLLLLAPTLALGAPTLAEKPKYYYGEKPLFEYKDKQLKEHLFHILASRHVSRDSKPDKITEDCGGSQNSRCYSYNKLSYKEAREYLFGFLDLEEGSDGYEVTSIYCLKRLTNDDFPKGKNLGPMKIPKSTIINTEHSWPQSKFSGNFPKSLQKSDLHALFPSLSSVNSSRGNHPFGPVTEPSGSLCDKAAVGYNDESSGRVFEPNDISKGNIARALFYFSVRYRMKIDPVQEKHLRNWHRMDPVDAVERARHHEVYGIQYTRNPFIDYPHLEENISDF